MNNKFFNTAVGLCDSLTGLMLILNPSFVLKFMWIAEIPEPDVYLRYIGIFVLGTGLTYFLPLFSADYNQASRYVWIQTGLIRVLVASFVCLQVATASLAPAWLIVAATDASIGFLQFALLFRERTK